MPKQRVAVIGAGPAGLTAAYQLSKAGVEVHLYEAGSAVGGMARSIDLWDQRVDLGPHRFFSSDPRVNKLWLEVVGTDYRMVDRLTRIYYRGRYFYYPLRAWNALRRLGPWEAARCLLSYGRERLSPTPEDGSFESWVVRRFGRRLFEIFFKTYSEKLWGIPCSELDADFAAQRIKKLSLFEAIWNALKKPTGGAAKHKTLVEQFAYPMQGTGLVYERMAEALQRQGGVLHLNRPVRRVLTWDHRAHSVEDEAGYIDTYDHIISSMPLSLLAERLPEIPAEALASAHSLEFRNTILVYLLVEGVDLFPDNWLYMHSPGLQVGRITNFRNWSPELYGQAQNSILTLEYWCYNQDELWTLPDSDLVDLATGELQQTGLHRGKPVREGKVVRLPRCYPVYSRGYKQRLEPLANYLRQVNNLQVIGRYGAFKYNNQDHSILMGLLAAENILNNAGHDLWAINTDYEYQESAIITATGLVRQ